MEPSNKVIHNFSISKYYKYSFVTEEGGFYGICYRNNAIIDKNIDKKDIENHLNGDKINSTFYTYKFGDNPNKINNNLNTVNSTNSSYLLENKNNSNLSEFDDSEDSVKLIKSSLLKISITHGLKAKDYSLITKYKDLLPIDNLLNQIEEKVEEIEKIINESSKYDKVIDFYFQQITDKIYNYFFLCSLFILLTGIFEFSYLKNFISRRKYV